MSDPNECPMCRAPRAQHNPNQAEACALKLRVRELEALVAGRAPTESQVLAAASAIANERGGRRGVPPVMNILALLPKDLVVEVTEDARAALAAALCEEPSFPRATLTVSARAGVNWVERRVVNEALRDLAKFLGKAGHDVHVTEMDREC